MHNNLSLISQVSKLVHLLKLVHFLKWNLKAWAKNMALVPGPCMCEVSDFIISTAGYGSHDNEKWDKKQNH